MNYDIVVENCIEQINKLFHSIDVLVSSAISKITLVATYKEVIILSRVWN